MRKRTIMIIPLGPGDPGLMTLQSAEALREKEAPLFLRTARHPAADWLSAQGVEYTSLDDYYDRYEDFDAMHQAMAERLWQEAEAGPVRLAVPDPENDGAVSALRRLRPEKGEISVLPGVSAPGVLLSALEESAGEGLQIFSATDFLTHAWLPENAILLTELDSALLAGDVKLRLGEWLGDEDTVFFFSPDAGAARKPQRIPLYQLDGQPAYDHTAAVFIQGTDYLHRERHTFGDLASVVSRLRAPDGCPWDRIQTHASLRPYMVEEAWEAVNAIEDEDPDHLADELGDVLFQVFIHASIGESFDEFTLTDVVSGICRKMIQRHPHVFGASHGETAEEISAGWEARKRAETGSKTVGESLDDVSTSLPALKFAIKMNKKLAQLPALRRDPEIIAEEIQHLAGELLPGGNFSDRAMARLLMKCTELCYRVDQDAEILLHRETEMRKKEYQAAEKSIFQDKKSPESLTFQQLGVYLSSVGEELPSVLASTNN